MLTLLYIVALPLRALVQAIDRGGRLRAGLDTGLRLALRGPWAAFVLGLPLVGALLASTWIPWAGIPTPDQSLIPNLPAAVAFSVAFAAGWLLHRQTAVMATIERQWALHFGAAAALTVACLSIVGVRPSGPAETLAVPDRRYAVLVTRRRDGHGRWPSSVSDCASSRPRARRGALCLGRLGLDSISPICRC